MRTLGIDIETYSSVDLSKAGVYAYASAPDFEVLLLAYAFGDGDIRLVDFARGEKLPVDLKAALVDPEVLKTAYNANFERACLSSFLGMELPPEQWECTMVHAWALGLSGSLGQVAMVLDLPEKEQKMFEGKALIRYFCIPCKATKTNDGRTRNLPEHAPEKWETFREYCVQDVHVERTIRRILGKRPVPKNEQRLWSLDQHINDRGVLIDLELARNAIECAEEYHERMRTEAIAITGLDNPNSVAQLKVWLQGNGLETDSLAKTNIPVLMQDAPSEDVRRVLEIRQEMAKASVKKYSSMVDCVQETDQRARGILQFYGARTGRWAGRRVQVHNLPQNKIRDLDLAHRLLKKGDYERIDMFYPSLPTVLSQLVRTAFVPSDGHRFIVADFSAIEARVIAWLADEKWRMDVFNSHGKIYEASAAQMFKVPIESVTKGSPLRQKGKVAELACGYGGSVGALKAMGALEMGLREEELKPIIDTWRAANPMITKLWKDVGAAVLKAVNGHQIRLQHDLTFRREGAWLFIRLPSGRDLAYYKPNIVENKFGRPALSYENKVPGAREETHGGKLVENIVQAVARDCLAEAMLNLDAAGYNIAMHVHDEVVLDVPIDRSSPDEVAEIMGRPIAWAPGLPLRADAYETPYYRKD